MIRTILELARELNAPRIYTAAALPRPMSHSAEPQLLYACNNTRLKIEMEELRSGTDAGRDNKRAERINPGFR